jgi:hypothetical protein
MEYCVFIEMIGSVYTAMIFAEMAVLITKMEKSSERYREKMEAANDFIRLHALPGDVKERIHRVIDYTFSQNQGVSTQAVADDLPEGLRVEIFMFLHAEKVSDRHCFSCFAV